VKLRWHFLFNVGSDSISPRALLFGNQLKVYLVVVLIKFVQLDSAHHLKGVIYRTSRPEVDFALKFVHENLLLLSNGDACSTTEGFDFVKTNFSIRGLHLDLL
jgi:hypothetical protein